MAWYITTGRQFEGLEFECESDDEDEICKAGWEVVSEHVSFGWKKIPTPKHARPKPAPDSGS